MAWVKSGPGNRYFVGFKTMTITVNDVRNILFSSCCCAARASSDRILSVFLCYFFWPDRKNYYFVTSDADITIKKLIMWTNRINPPSDLAVPSFNSTDRIRNAFFYSSLPLQRPQMCFFTIPSSCFRKEQRTFNVGLIKAGESVPASAAIALGHEYNCMRLAGDILAASRFHYWPEELAST